MCTFEEIDAEQQTYKESFEASKKAASEWREKWPQHCQACQGWGGASFTQSHPYGMGQAQETLYDPCGALEKATTCHRCGQGGLGEDGEGPCKHCGWNYDDGVPQW